MPDSETTARTLTLVNRKGLHARAAARFVQVVDGFEAEITVEKDGQSVSGVSIMGLLMLAATCGSQIAVRGTGPEATAAVEAVAALVEDGFGEND